MMSMGSHASRGRVSLTGLLGIVLALGAAAWGDEPKSDGTQQQDSSHDASEEPRASFEE